MSWNMQIRGHELDNVAGGKDKMVIKLNVRAPIIKMDSHFQSRLVLVLLLLPLNCESELPSNGSTNVLIIICTSVQLLEC